jgi:hypothetical protein
MEEEENHQQQQQQNQTKPDFSEYEWMMDLEEFDSQAMQRIEQDDDLDDMFYWDPLKGCTEGKSASKKDQPQNSDIRTNQHSQNNQNTHNSQNYQNSQNAHNVQKQQNTNISLNPFSSNFQNTVFQQHESKQNSGFQNTGIQNAGFQNTGFQNGSQNFQSPFHKQQEVLPADELANAMGGVNLNKFNLNPDATTFVPSWLKK